MFGRQRPVFGDILPSGAEEQSIAAESSVCVPPVRGRKWAYGRILASRDLWRWRGVSRRVRVESPWRHSGSSAMEDGRLILLVMLATAASLCDINQPTACHVPIV